jgi:hypothetical protein
MPVAAFDPRMRVALPFDRSTREESQMPQKRSITGIACTVVLGVFACATKPSENRSDHVTYEARTVSTDADDPSCPSGKPPLCQISNIDLADGAPRRSDQCAPVIVVQLAVGETSFTWLSPLGQLVDAALVRAGTSTHVYTYDPAVSADAEPLTAPTHAQLNRITFCGTLGARADGGSDAPPEPPTHDGGKTW